MIRKYTYGNPFCTDGGCKGDNSGNGDAALSEKDRAGGQAHIFLQTWRKGPGVRTG